MRPPLAAVLTSIGLAIAAAFPGLASAQAPTPLPRQIEREVPTQITPGQPTAPPAPDASASTASTLPDTTSSNAPVTQATGGTGLTKLGTGAQQTTSSAQYAATDRSYTAGRFALLIEGKPVLFVKKLEGGTLVGEVGNDASEGGAGTKKHLTGTKVEEISAVVGISDKPFMDWVAQSWNGSQPRRSGRIVTADFNYKSVGERDFSDAVITETTVPKLDGSSKDVGYFTVKIQPEGVQFSKGDGASIQPSVGPKQKMWLASNFGFAMDGLATTRVASIESFTVRQPATSKVGDVRETKGSSRTEFPNLQLSISQADFSSWSDWYTDFVVNRNNDDKHEKNGAILLFEPNMKAELGRINLFNCGIFRLGDSMEANSEKIKRFTADLYCERMELDVKGTVN
jgi:hypothetical protein